MATVETFGDLHYRTVSPDELAYVARYALQYGLSAPPEEGQNIRTKVRALFPVLHPLQLSILLNAFAGAALSASWQSFQGEIERLLN